MPSSALEGVTLHVENVERSLEFYSKIPGAVVEARSLPHFAMLRIGTARLGLLGYNQQQRFHIEIVTDDLDTMYETLRSVGIEPNSPPKQQDWGERDFLVTDPDGNLVEFGVSHS